MPFSISDAQALIGRSIELRDRQVRGVIKSVTPSGKAFVKQYDSPQVISISIADIKLSRGLLFIPEKQKGANHATGN